MTKDVQYTVHVSGDRTLRVVYLKPDSMPGFHWVRDDKGNALRVHTEQFATRVATDAGAVPPATNQTNKQQ